MTAAKKSLEKKGPLAKLLLGIDQVELKRYLSAQARAGRFRSSEEFLLFFMLSETVGMRSTASRALVNKLRTKHIPEVRALLVRAVWEVLALSGNVDPYGSRQYHRYEPLVAKFVQTIHDECNVSPSARRHSESRQASKKEQP
jgi:hypothetical protein